MKRARLEQSGVKSTAAMPVLMHAAFCYLCMMTKDAIASRNVRYSKDTFKLLHGLDKFMSPSSLS